MFCGGVSIVVVVVTVVASVVLVVNVVVVVTVVASVVLVVNVVVVVKVVVVRVVFVDVIVVFDVFCFNRSCCEYSPLMFYHFCSSYFCFLFMLVLFEAFFLLLCHMTFKLLPS